MTHTPTQERLKDAVRCLPSSKDNKNYIGCTGQHHKNFLGEFEDDILFALRFTAKALGEPTKCDITGNPCKIHTGNQYTHGTGVCVDCGVRPIAGTSTTITRGSGDVFKDIGIDPDTR